MHANKQHPPKMSVEFWPFRWICLSCIQVMPKNTSLSFTRSVWISPTIVEKHSSYCDLRHNCISSYVRKSQIHFIRACINFNRWCDIPIPCPVRMSLCVCWVHCCSSDQCCSSFKMNDDSRSVYIYSHFMNAECMAKRVPSTRMVIHFICIMYFLLPVWSVCFVRFVNEWPQKYFKLIGSMFDIGPSRSCIKSYGLNIRKLEKVVHNSRVSG